jgi:iron complex transport system substrate-binding protein
MARFIRSVSGAGRVAFTLPVIALIVSVVVASCTLQNRTPSDGPPQRIVSLVPTVTEILFAIGAGDRVVGISDYDTYPAEALNRPRVGALIDPNIEKIFELDPDLVITYGTQSLLQERLAVGGIRQFPFVTGPVDHILGSIRALGRDLDLDRKAETLASEIEGRLDRLRETRPADPPRVLLVHSRDAGNLGGFYSAGGDSYFGELLDIAGGQNLFDDVGANAFQPTLEEVLNRGPEVIVELLPSSGDTPGELARRREDWSVLTSVPAVRNQRVYVLAGDHLLLVGPRLAQVADELAAVIRTEALTSR